ncbi:ricin-type beta-trefoil lectin domain protein [Actinoplanes sp. NPDC049265]|uniref:ricin-type beta-trefoil lectin domain protein n=1 Tax=Actinoplanes sp. NPDC049265 TaxID=3363902 RepID=UPI0037204DFB
MIGRFWRARRAARRRDEGSMPAAMMVTLVAMTLSAAIAPFVANQIVSTRTISARTDALQAAQAGIDVALGQLRAAATAGSGDLESLPPCTMTGPSMTGSQYQVAIVYYRLADDGAPTPQDCPPTDVPVSAKLTSIGGAAGLTLAQGARGTRTLESTYTFKTSNENISGGAVQLSSPTVGALCMDAGLDTFPAAGNVVKAQLCKNGGTAVQRFAYTADLNIKLVGSETTSAPSGMCLDVPYPRALNDTVKFQPCLGLSARQQWSINDSSEFSSTRENAPVLNDFCLSLLNPGVAGSDIVLGSCAAVSNKNVWRPQAGVGAGMSSAATNQLVNFKQFSRCLDVTNFRPDWPYMIVWFCKQAPNGVPPWNQAWYLSSGGTNILQKRIRTIDGSGNGWCLTTPGSVAASTYATLTSCSATGTLNSNQVWTVYGDTGVYASSYRIVDSNGYCLTPTDLTASPADTHTDGTAKVKLAVCSSSELQKWNAPPDLNKPTALTNTKEK